MKTLFIAIAFLFPRNELPPGTYTIKNEQSNRYLKAKEDCMLNCCELIQESSSSGDDVKWIIEKAPGASYTIKSKLTSKLIDADALATRNDGCKVHLCSRLQALQNNQQWRIEKLTNGNYRIKCVAGNKPIRVAPECAAEDGCRFELFQPENHYTQQWVLQKVD